MEGGNKQNINLEAGLEISTSDMLVPISQPTFQHNWQRYQGKYLPNSLRFEKNGWAAGWNVYNFDYNMFRLQLSDSTWAQLSNLNVYAKLLALYPTKKSLKETAHVVVVPANVLVTGDVSINGNVITGVLNDKQFNITWDPETQQLSMETEGFSIISKTNANYTTTVTVSDDTEGFSLDFDLYIATEMTGDSIAPAKMSSFDGTDYLWGKYKYNIDTNEMTTPEGVVLNPTISDNNLLTFDYNANVNDEKVNISYTLEKHYPKFTNIWFKDNSNEQMIIGSNPSTEFQWDLYSATSDKSILLAKDEDGVVVDWKLPLWATCSFTVERPDPNAKKCDNVSNYEITTLRGTGFNMGGTYTNIWDGNGTFTIDNSYRPHYTKYLNGITHRFNQIFLNNTIELSTSWDYRKHLLNSQVWFSDSRRYANIRNKRSVDMTKLLGNVYTWGAFYVDPCIIFDYNNPYDVSDKDNCIYTKEDISQILSFKLRGTADNTDEGEDQDFIDSNLIIDETLIAIFSGSVTEYDYGQAAKEYAELYVNGTYVGTTYETVGVSEEPFWPFEKVPKFNFKDANGIIHKGVYWTDGVNIIDDFDIFRITVLGTYDDTVDVMNIAIKENSAYNRTRIVNQYAAGYDFDFIKKSSYERQLDYISDVNVWNEIWNKYYPNTPSPQDTFDELAVSSDDTYFDYVNVQILTNIDPQIKCVKPGVYLFNKFAVPYNCPSGLIIFDDGDDYSLSANVWHHSVQTDSQYTINYAHEAGIITFNGVSINIPFYFGSDTYDSLVSGTNSNTFRQITSLAGLKSAKLTIGVNYEYTKIKHEDSDGHIWYTWEWTRIYPQNTNWLGNLLAYYSSGEVTIEDAALNTGVEQVQYDYYYTGDINSGIKFAWPVWGHSATRILYPEMRKTSNINEEDAFIIAPVDTADLADTNKIYWDRDDTDKSVLLFKISENSKQPDDSQGGGNIVLKIENAGDESCLWYAKKVVDSQNNEITYPYYIPGIAYGGQISNTSGNMTALQSDYPMLKLNWTPTIYKIPVNAFASYIVINSLGSQHSYFSNDKDLVVPEIVLGDFDPENMLMSLVLKINSIEVPFAYNVADQKTVYDAGDIVVIDNTDVDKLTVTSISGSDELAVVKMLLDLIFKNNTARFYKSSDSDITIKSASGSQVAFKKGSITIKYDYVQQRVLSPRSEIGVTTIENGQHLKIEGNSELVFTAALTNAVNGKVTIEGYEVNLADFEDRDEGVKVISTDIRTNKDKVIGYIKDSSQHPLYQLIRQQWNTTVEVENYWWVDDSHVLELNQENFVLKRKTDEYDDWNGDRFEKVYEVLRSNILPTNILRYFVTNVYNDTHSALLVVLKEEDGKINITLLNIREKFEVVATFYVSVRNRDIGKQLNDVNVLGDIAYLNTYNPLTNGQIISAAEWSNTLTDDRVIIGIHLSNNYDQWAIVFNLEKNVIEYCIQGYGYVGLHGDLTGGQIPDDYFDTTKGFNNIVQPLSVLQPLTERDLNDLDAAYEVGNKDKINQIDPKVVGTSEQQWYIQLKLYGVVSHLKYAGNGTFTKQILPITNNYTASYKSPSFASAAAGDVMVQVSALESLLSFEGSVGTAWTTIMSLLGYPMIYYIAPRFGSIIHLQQTFGQYAYVHYNSSKSPPEKDTENSSTDSGISDNKKKQTDPVLTSSFVFDKQKFSQEGINQFDIMARAIFTIITAIAGALTDTTNEKLSLNEEQNQSAVSDFGRKFLDNVADNVSDMLSTNISTKSRFNQGLSCVVTGVKSLDMFYSTSDQQHVMAGPGFVEHQFVANCVAQSVTSLQVEGKIYQLYWCIRGLTSYQIELEIAMEELAIKKLRDLADASKSAMVCGTTFGPAIATGLYASASALEYLIATQKKALEFIDKFFDVLCTNGITCNQDGYVSRHALSVEGKHKYGEKNEVFMWPCWGINSGELRYTDEWVESGIRNTPWKLSLDLSKAFTQQVSNIIAFVPFNYSIANYSDAEGDLSDFYDAGQGGKYSSEYSNKTNKAGYIYRAAKLLGGMPHFQASCYGNSRLRTLPDDMAKVEGVTKFLPEQPFKNENIAVSEPAFAPSLQQDYKIDEAWDLGMYCTYGLTQWITVQDTKVIDCPPSNMVVRVDFCGIACPYTAVEVKRGLSKAYMRPWAITPNALAFNATGYNTILDNKLYHAFDGISYRLVDLIGSPGMNKNRQSFWYSIQVNDRFKRSNIIPANELQGNFESEPIQAVVSIDKLWSLMTIAAKEKGLEAGTIGEDKDNIRWSIPIFTEHVSTLPAAVKTMTAVPLAVVAGVTGLVVDLANNQVAYKAPLSVDFTIGKNVYRATEEYICSVQTQDGIDVVTDLVPSLGLKFIGATPTEAYFYSKSTRCYYTFTGSTLVKMDMMERFRDIQKGYWDFVNQEVVMPCLMTYKRLNPEVEDKDTETDNVIVPVLSKNQVSGELPVPLTTIFNDRSWYKCLSLPCGFAYQGPNRVIINRSVFIEYMLEGIKDNLGKWGKLRREKYGFNRTYPEVYQDVVTDVQGVDGWTHNPFVLVTSPLGSSNEDDCLYEWEITFCWPIEMDLIYGVDNYAVVNIAAETMTPGGKVKSRPTHIFLTKELFTRNGNYGYYSFRFQSKNGAGNRERLFIWSDQYIAISSLVCESKVVTSKRTSQLTQQLDVQKLNEL